MQKVTHLVTLEHEQQQDEVKSGKEFSSMGGAPAGHCMLSWQMSTPEKPTETGVLNWDSIESQFQEIKPTEMRNPSKEPQLRFKVAPN